MPIEVIKNSIGVVKKRVSAEEINTEIGGKPW